MSVKHSVLLAAISAFVFSLASLTPTIYVDQHYAVRLIARLCYIEYL